MVVVVVVVVVVVLVLIVAVVVDGGVVGVVVVCVAVVVDVLDICCLRGKKTKNKQTLICPLPLGARDASVKLRVPVKLPVSVKQS